MNERERDILQLITEWQREIADKVSVNSTLIHLYEEFVEFMQQVKEGGDKEKAIEEAADIVFMLNQYCWKATGKYLSTALWQKLSKNKSRQWNEPDKYGRVKHVKKEEHVGDYSTDLGVW